MQAVKNLAIKCLVRVGTIYIAPSHLFLYVNRGVFLVLSWISNSIELIYFFGIITRANVAICINCLYISCHNIFTSPNEVAAAVPRKPPRTSTLYRHTLSSYVLYAPYPYLATDYGTQLSLFTHHMWIGGFLIVGAAAHAAIFMVRDYDPTTRYNDLLDRD
ncbi:hypothetical protein ACJX0J_007092 [Zea mays]